MPIAKKQTPPAPANNKKWLSASTSSPTQTSNLLDQIVPVNVIETKTRDIKVSLYGRGKTGKTRVLATFPKPVLIIGSEDGTESIRTEKDVFFIQVLLKPPKDPTAKRWILLEDIGTFIEQVAQQDRYRTIGVDTASNLQDIILADVLKLHDIPVQKSWGLATREQYGTVSVKLKRILRGILDLPTNVVITAHERNFNEDAPAVETSELMLPSVGSALSPSAAGWLNGAVDYICQTFIRGETIEEAAPIKGSTETIRTPTGKSEFCLRLGPHPVYMTGFRLPPGFSLPDVIVNPTYDKIKAVIDGRTK